MEGNVNQLTEQDKSDIILSHQYRLSLKSKPSQSNFRVLALLFYEEKIDSCSNDTVNDEEEGGQDGGGEDEEEHPNQRKRPKINKESTSHTETTTTSTVRAILPPWICQTDPATGRTFVVGTNDEPGYIGGSICAERAAMVQLRFVPSFRLTKIVISTDAPTVAVPCGMLCREFLAGHGRSVPINVPIISTGSQCQRCKLHDEDLFGEEQRHRPCTGEHSDHSLPTLQTTLSHLFPLPSPYTRLSASQSVMLGKAYRDRLMTYNSTSEISIPDQNSLQLSFPTKLNEITKRLLKLAVEEAIRTNDGSSDDYNDKSDDRRDNRDPIHPIQFGAAMLLDDDTIVVCHQSSALEYGCTLDAVSQLTSHINKVTTTTAAEPSSSSKNQSRRRRPLIIVQADQYGIAHAPFAPARAWLSERGYDNVQFVVHFWDDTDDQLVSNVGVDEASLTDITRLRLSLVTLYDLAPDPPTWNTPTTTDNKKV